MKTQRSTQPRSAPSTPSVKLRITNLSPRHRPGPATGGVPLPQGAAPRGARFAVCDHRGRPVPAQTTPLARWPDGSARWVLVDLQADPPPRSSDSYALIWSRTASAMMPAEPLRVPTGSNPAVRTNAINLVSIDGNRLRIADRLSLALHLTDARGRDCVARIDSVTVESRGPLRAAIVAAGSFTAGTGRRWFGFRLRATAYAGLPRLKIEPMIDLDVPRGVLQKIRRLELIIEPDGGIARATLAGRPGWTGSPARNTTAQLFQIDDTQYRPNGKSARRGKAPGWACIETQAGPVAVALRDFWQRWPKSLAVDAASLRLGLLPRFTPGQFKHMTPWYKHQYLFDGASYQLKTGQRRRWEIWIDLAGDGVDLARWAEAPLTVAAEPADAIAAGVWGDIAPAGTPGLKAFDQWSQRLFEAYAGSIRRQRDYGEMNFGDWFGERMVNWGNNEYDTPWHLMTLYARTADPKYFHAADAAARHMSEVDVVHALNRDLIADYNAVGPHPPGFPPRPGLVHEHCVGHVGGFYSIAAVRRLLVSFDIGKSKRPYLCLDPYNLGHVWTQGMARHYLLTGDPWMRETVDLVGASLARLVEDGKYRYFTGSAHSGRVAGWTLLALAGAYEIALDQRLRRAMKKIVDPVLAEQDPICGGWLNELPWGHCFCTYRKHVGEAGFITGVRLMGLCRYFELTGDRRIPQAVRRGIDFLNADTWNADLRDWRYTSCPASQAAIGQIGTTLMALAQSVAMTNDPRQRHILREAWNAKFHRLLSDAVDRPGFGKSYTTTVLGSAEAAGMLAKAK